MCNFIKSIFTKKFWVAPFPKDLPPECFDCKKTSGCKGCKYLNKK